MGAEALVSWYFSLRLDLLLQLYLNSAGKLKRTRSGDVLATNCDGSSYVIALNTGVEQGNFNETFLQ